MIPISDLVKVKTDTLQKTIYRKDQKRVVYVTLIWLVQWKPCLCHFGMTEKLYKIEYPKGYELNELYMDQPTDESDYTVKWDGEADYLRYFP
jgi:hypothetical protein